MLVGREFLACWRVNSRMRTADRSIAPLAEACASSRRASISSASAAATAGGDVTSTRCLDVRRRRRSRGWRRLRRETTRVGAAALRQTRDARSVRIGHRAPHPHHELSSRSASSTRSLSGNGPGRDDRQSSPRAGRARGGANQLEVSRRPSRRSRRRRLEVGFAMVAGTSGLLRGGWPRVRIHRQVLDRPQLFIVEHDRRRRVVDAPGPRRAALALVRRRASRFDRTSNRAVRRRSGRGALPRGFRFARSTLMRFASAAVDGFRGLAAAEF